MTSRRESGFTLLELIVAAGIMALIAVFSWRGLDTLIREREAIAASQAAIDGFQRAFARLERDALLANDVQLDDEGTMRLVAGSAALDGAPASTVEYRLLGGALTRAVTDVDSAPLVVLDGVTSIAMEAWLPVPGGGGWVRVKPAATEAPRPAPVDNTPAQVPNSASQPNGTQPQPVSGAPNVPGIARGSTQPAGPTVGIATGIRLSFARTDGTQVTRTFMVGGS